MITLPSPLKISSSTVSIPIDPKITFIDDGSRVGARIEGLPALILWEGDAYKSIGDWTQLQAEARIVELLGNDPVAVLQNLFKQ
jgi:hypothetical protein